MTTPITSDSEEWGKKVIEILTKVALTIDNEYGLGNLSGEEAVAEHLQSELDAILTLLEGEIHKARLGIRLDDEFVGSGGVQYKLVPAKKAKITKIGFVKDGVASCWNFDCMDGVPPSMLHDSVQFIGGWTMQELELISAAKNIVYDKVTRTYKGEK